MDYKIIRSQRKTISIEIKKDKSITVRAPLRASDEYVDKVVRSKKAWIEKHLASISEKDVEKELTPLQIKAYTDAAKKILPEKVRYYSGIMGIYPTAITVTGARTRFGSCSGKNRICFSYHLMRYPEAAIDYVVVHELAHIKHKNHGKEFYAFIEKFLPDYKEREKILRSAPKN